MRRPGRDESDSPPSLSEVRLDVFLDVACLFPTRAKAAAACAGGKVDLNGRAAAAHKLVRTGDRLQITFERSRRSFVVRELADRHVPKALARTFVEDTTPPPSPEVLEARRLERLLAPRPGDDRGRPTKKERRDREKLRGF